VPTPGRCRAPCREASGTGRDHRVLVLVDVELVGNWLNGREGSQQRQAGMQAPGATQRAVRTISEARKCAIFRAAQPW
jgi:hypothetical protein